MSTDENELKQETQTQDENAVIVEVTEVTFEHLVLFSPVPVLLEFYLPTYIHRIFQTFSLSIYEIFVHSISYQIFFVFIWCKLKCE
jgi:hypothetical protein